MQNNPKTKNEQQMSEQNPTLNAPGSQVADYGDVEGGEGTEDARSHRETDRADRRNTEPLRGDQQTAGNP